MSQEDYIAPAPGGNDMPFHPIADISPLLAQGELNLLKADILANGLRDPIILHEGKVLDGRNRYIACKETGVAPTFFEMPEGDPLDYVVSRNLHRRHLDDGQRSMVAARISHLRVGANQHRKEGVPNGTAATLLNVSGRSVARSKNVLKRGIPDLVHAVDTDKLTVAAAEQIALQPQTEQKEALQARLEEKKSKQKNKKANGTKSSTKETPAPPQPAKAAPTEQPQAATGARAGDSATVIVPYADNADNAALLAFANFVLMHIDRQGDTIVLTVAAEDMSKFELLADRVRAVIGHQES